MSDPAPPTVEIANNPDVTGLWFRTGRGTECVALVAEDGGEPRLEFYSEHGPGYPNGEPVVWTLADIRYISAWATRDAKLKAGG